MNYKDLLKDVDYTNPEDVVKCGLSILQDNEMANEQKLYALGLLINKNKEQYINEIKNRLIKRCEELDQLKSENAALKKKVTSSQSSEPKKKVVIKVKRKE